MYDSFKILLYILIFFFSLSAIIPISQNKYWLIRAFDFPRLQVACINLILLLVLILFSSWNAYDFTALFFLSVGIILDAYRITPYMPFSPKESKDFSGAEDNRIKILCFNVLIENERFRDCIDLIKKQSPDFVVLVETDSKWFENLQDLNKIFPYQINQAQENGYGILVYSKYKINDHKINFLVDDNVPSINLEVQLNENPIHIVVLHPRPPGLKKKTSKQRDNELTKVAKHINESVFQPCIVVGDFNDVAWSHTSRTFLRDSNLLDPRRGRGFYSTFPTNYPFFRYPLDHIFHTKEFKLIEIERLDHIGSDHYPISITLAL